ncbi:SlyX protein [Pasteurellaceae bacterium HPA106]|uniref:SlyX family protein n=1 Tax=Spirabiliibacterium pneumoniae TaxID=221400 RepID=UPI001AAC47C3|nr:SlyX family protein [Spirabiliibacterium pneumoniae]MBE2897213.1 SlyX protein [Spirabiliibacterium pneumoniae]
MMNEHALLSQIAELETKITFQEGMIDDLNQALITQQFAIDKLQQQVRLLAQKLTDLQPSNIASMSEETPPPHY